MNTVKKPRIIAHRGASAYAPENTLIAFVKALDMRAEGLELDVHMSKDGILVVCHDARVDRTSNGKGLIKDFTLEELKTLDFGSWFSPEFAGERIPTLQEVLDLIKDWDGLLNIEIKNGPIFYPEIEEKLIEMVRAYKAEDKIIFSSFNHYSLRHVKALAPEMKTGLLYQEGMVEPWRYALFMKAEALHPHYFNIIPEMVQGCNENGIQLNPWTIDDEEQIKVMVRFGVDGIITNKPDLALRIRQSVLG